MTMKYPREAVVAAIDSLTADEFSPINEVVEADGVHPFMCEAARLVGADLADDLTSSFPDVTIDVETLAQAAEVGILHGLRIGLRLAQNEERLAGVMDLLRRDGSLKVHHYATEDAAVRDGLEFHQFAKVGGTRLARVQGHFSCETIDGNIAHCEDGWLAIDADGHLYPVADSVARASYALDS